MTSPPTSCREAYVVYMLIVHTRSVTLTFKIPLKMSIEASAPWRTLHILAKYNTGRSRQLGYDIKSAFNIRAILFAGDCLFVNKMRSKNLNGFLFPHLKQIVLSIIFFRYFAGWISLEVRRKSEFCAHACVLYNIV